MSSNTSGPVGSPAQLQEPRPPASFMQTLKRLLLGRGFDFYRRWLRGTPIGLWLRAQLVKRGIIPPLGLGATSWNTTRPPQVFEEDFEGDAPAIDPTIPGFHWSQPLNLEVSAVCTLRPHINVLLPSLRTQDMSGGPNTALLLAAHLAQRGEAVRLIATSIAAGGKEAALYPHMDVLFRRAVDRERIALVDGNNRSQPIQIGANDIFLATAWWTAQMAKYAVQKTNYNKFIYLIQDFEPILHEGSTLQALALESYGLPHIPVVNTQLLLDHLSREACGLYAERSFVENALVFEPAIDRAHFHPDIVAHNRQASEKRVLLFYARPTIAQRNLFGMGVAALRKAVAGGLLNEHDWEVWGMGEDFSSVQLGRGVVLMPLPWMSFEAYAERMRTADLLLSLMLSPHPSYPPLEMAACANMVVTNSFSVKTASRLQELSRNILVAEPTLDGIAAALENAVARINAGISAPDITGAIDLPSDWNASLQKVMPGLMEQIGALRQKPTVPERPIHRGSPAVPASEYERFRRNRLVLRRRDGAYRQEPGLLSFVTCAYNTDPAYLEELAGSVFLQDGGTNFEWLILDNGSTNPATSATLRTIAAHRCVRLERVEENLGIVGGMRYCLQHASGRYILPLDSDDLLEPDCVHVLTRFLQEADYPAIAYTDEDKVADGRFELPYFKPDWDPVLFVHSCYIAHLCVIDREKALALDAYGDPDTEGSHDWDTFIRFMNAGYTPLHVPEVLYSWRMHDESTSANIASKSYISDSHRKTLQRFLDHTGTRNIELTPSPLFHYNVDWWYRRKRSAPRSCVSVLLGSRAPKTSTSDPVGGTMICLDPAEGPNGLAGILERNPADLVHLSWEGIVPDSDEWLWEAMAITELFPDTVMVGGTLHDGKHVLEGPLYFGFGEGFDCPDRGHLLTSPGYSALMWKPHSVSALSSGHCIVQYGFLLNALRKLSDEHVPLTMLGPWLGGLAREVGRRVVFSPFFGANAKSTPEIRMKGEDRAQFMSRFWHLMPETRLISPRLGLTVETSYTPVLESERTQHLRHLQRHTLHYPRWLERELRHRTDRYPIPNVVPAITILTAVYEGSDPALLNRLADSIRMQTLRPAEWLIVVNGPLTETNLRSIREHAEPLWGATLVVEPESLGIIGATRRGLEAARGEYIVLVDADDELTLDAVQILAHEIDRLDAPDFLYSDEDTLIDGEPSAPYMRAPFDPVLNLESSYIWHLYAIKRGTALRLGAYSDSRMNWCQDWDTVTRVANAGGRMVHVPEILYHWRRHRRSTTNRPRGDPRSFESVRHLLQQQIEIRAARPWDFSVETRTPGSGLRDPYIARKDTNLPAFVWVGDLAADGMPGRLDQDAILVATAPAVSINGEGAFKEVARLLELHPRLAAVGGRVLNNEGMILDACFVNNAAGGLECPWVGHHVEDVGPYALAAKAQTVAATGAWMAFFRIRAIRDAGIPLPGKQEALPPWIMSTCAQLAAAQWAIAYSPLIVGKASGPAPAAASLHAFSTSANCSMQALARYGRMCPHNFYWGTYIP